MEGGTTFMIFTLIANIEKIVGVCRFIVEVKYSMIPGEW